MFDKVLKMPLDYLNCFVTVYREIHWNVWYMPNWLYYSLTNNFPFFLNSYMEVQNSSKQKVNKGHRKKINYSIWCFWYFFHFLHTNVLENKYNKQKWHMLFFTCIKSVAHKLPCADLIACIKWKRLQTRSKHVK